MRPYLILVLFCLIGSKLYGQSFYATDINGKFHRITVTNGTINDVAVTSCSGTAQSAAYHRNMMYYTDGNQLYKADMINNALVNCMSLGAYQPFNSLTVDKNGLLYLMANNRNLYTYDPVTRQAPKLIGTVPYQPSGDLIFYKDKLYMASLNGIVQVDAVTPANSTLVIPTGSDILGLAVVSVSGTVNAVYALSSGASITTLIELDLDNYTIKQSVGYLPYYVYDAASNVEDGSYIMLDIDEIKTTAECPFTGNGTVQVISYNATSAYKYTLGSQTNTNGLFAGVSPGQYTVSVTNGPETKQKQINIPQFQLTKPTLTVDKISPKCLDKGSITFTATVDADQYTLIYKGISYPLNSTFANLTAGSHHFDVVNKAGCVVDTRNETLEQATCSVFVDSTVIRQDCNDPKKGAVTVYTSPGSDKYHFTLNNGTSNGTGSFEGLTPGNYLMNIMSDGGGTKDVQFSIQDLSINDPQVSYQKTDITCATNGSVKFDISTTTKSGYKVMYRSVSYPLDHIFSITDSGYHEFRILKPSGCLLKIETVIISRQDCETVFFPNTFTPNSDGVNDIFRPKEGTTAKNLVLNIFNRLGTLVYTSDKAGNGWDGKYQGKQAPAGVYYWIASYTNNEGKSIKQQGAITLLR